MNKGGDTVPGLSPALFWCDGNVSGDLSIYHDEDVRRYALIATVASTSPYTLQRTPLDKLLIAHKKKEKIVKEFQNVNNFHKSMKDPFSNSFPHGYCRPMCKGSFAKSHNDIFMKKAGERNIIAVILQCLK
ncbi:hypothetical protein GUITHDRAFT_100798 [Guillardia theta CCMP2712]|uniref:Uncharacterized protein n=1 Tax=Guillardia theta (strain CCMP2712) TaxID=905079 RepID=L1JZQ7_GUITC|nr:hypothetical protein GUITHDRAFT_100798 [Guillardia theta CCMP2712]EKX53832.1 hypothetical protein GUITHDRAFT_100798 [Guillardia theta CCMP2712]|eukprot:XP_005840812.1 hypothetical protein GUITHDRAFT_100798 [Guillardia theta CCMP2712]